MSDLAGSYADDRPGLPRGRGRLESEEVQGAQRERILRAAVAVFADRGYGAATVADIVGGARVSRRAFYAQFAGKEECFLAAIAAGREVLVPRVVAAARAAAPDDLAAALRAAAEEYVGQATREPEFTRAWTVELPLVGPEGRRMRNEHLSAMAAALEELHRRHLGAGRDSSALPPTSYLALIGGCHELFYRAVLADPSGELPGLAGSMVEFVLAGLRD